jgi:hypothetical protein
MTLGTDAQGIVDALTSLNNTFQTISNTLLTINSTIISTMSNANIAITSLDSHIANIQIDIHTMQLLASNVQVGIAINSKPDEDLHSVDRAIKINALRKSDNIAAVSTEMKSPTVMPQ